MVYFLYLLKWLLWLLTCRFKWMLWYCFCSYKCIVYWLKMSQKALKVVKISEKSGYDFRWSRNEIGFWYEFENLQGSDWKAFVFPKLYGFFVQSFVVRLFLRKSLVKSLISCMVFVRIELHRLLLEFFFNMLKFVSGKLVRLSIYDTIAFYCNFLNLRKIIEAY